MKKLYLFLLLSLASVINADQLSQAIWENDIIAVKELLSTADITDEQLVHYLTTSEHTINAYTHQLSLLTSRSMKSRSLANKLCIGTLLTSIGMKKIMPLLLGAISIYRNDLNNLTDYQLLQIRVALYEYLLNSLSFISAIGIVLTEFSDRSQNYEKSMAIQDFLMNPSKNDTV